MSGIASLGNPDLEISGRTPLRIWVVPFWRTAGIRYLIPTRIPGIFLAVAPMKMEVNDGHKGNGRAPKRTAEAVAP